jgi:cytochrome c
MKRRELIAMTAGLALLSLTTIAAAETSPTPEEAKAMVQETVAYFEANGAEAMIARVNDGRSFRDGELYVFIVRLDGINVAHAADGSNLGKDVRTLQDADGKFYGREILERATADGVWVHYKRINPAAGRVQPKRSWVRKVDGYVIGCGVYESE